MRICRRSQLSPIALDHPPMVALYLQGRRTRVAIVVVTTILYLLLFVPSFAFLGAGAAALALLPVVVAGWLLGRPAGFAAGLGSIPLNTLLLHLVGIPGWD